MTTPTLPDHILAALDAASANDATVERLARYLEPDLWAKIDQWIEDDDWNGGTALNARDRSIKHARDTLASFKKLP